MTGKHAWDPDQVRAWIADDPDPSTADELSALLDAATQGDDAARRDLVDRFGGLLQFGTAGLRGPLGGGPNRMNRAVVIRAAAGLGAYLHGRLADETPTVVIGYDARHRSADFAHDSAAVLTAAGLQVLLLPRSLPTPVLAFAVRHLGADAGIMVTASHNPAADNGYKVYLGGRAVTGPGQGAQIVPPMDADIAAMIAAVESVASVPRAQDGWTVLGEDVVDAYVAAVSALAPLDDESRARAGALRIVLTPMHGVGAATATRVLAEAGFTDVAVVPEQAEPDPDFPTVAFPNPEEPGALDLALALAREREADLVVALDPDADRCSVAVVDPHVGGWRQLHGDEVGALLGTDAADHAAQGTLASSIVSSRLLSRIAAAAGLGSASTLTGFKWISRTEGLVFGYEEALGYCVAPALVRDKDGISASVRVATLAATLKAQGRGLADELDQIARRHGLYLTGQVAARFDDPGTIAAVIDRLRTAAPTVLAGSPVTTVTDLSAGVDGLLPTDGFRLFTAADDRVVVRPSGTEPKVKCYLEVVVPLEPDASDETVAAARTAARARLDTLASDLRTALDLPEA
jgi:phosphomannomutase